MVEGWKSVWQNFEPTLAVFFMFLGNFLILQIANVEKISPSGYTVQIRNEPIFQRLWANFWIVFIIVIRKQNCTHLISARI